MGSPEREALKHLWAGCLVSCPLAQKDDSEFTCHASWTHKFFHLDLKEPPAMYCYAVPTSQAWKCVTLLLWKTLESLHISPLAATE